MRAAAYENASPGRGPSDFFPASANHAMRSAFKSPFHSAFHGRHARMLSIHPGHPRRSVLPRAMPAGRWCASAATMMACASVAVIAGAAWAAEPFIEKTNLFTIGEGGYKVFHRPGVVVTATGTVLAWCEAPKKGGDWDANDLIVRRSKDGGKSWSKTQKLPEVPARSRKIRSPCASCPPFEVHRPHFVAGCRFWPRADSSPLAAPIEQQASFGGGIPWAD